MTRDGGAGGAKLRLPREMARWQREERGRDVVVPGVQVRDADGLEHEEPHAGLKASEIISFQAEDGIRDDLVTGVQTCALPIYHVGLEVSMSRTGDCYDNAAMESFFATLKKECIYRQKFQNRREARQAVFEYLECFYNPVRLHSTLGYTSPRAFEEATDHQMS